MINVSARSRLIAATSPFAMTLALASTPAFAGDNTVAVTGAETKALVQNTAAPPSSTSANPNDTKADSSAIVVTGFRAALRSATSTKKRQDQIVEAVNAEDIGKLPDNSIAESIARLPGLAAQRSNGRANILSIRGFGPDFSVTTLNGREQTTTDDSRAVEFDQYPSEVINQVVVYKSAAADLVPQGLVGTIDLRTIRPLDAGKRLIAVGARGTYVDQKLFPDSQDKGFRVFGTYVDQFANNTLGVALSATYTSEPYQTKDWEAWDYSPLTPDAYKINGVKMWYETSLLKRLGLSGTVQARVSDDITMTLDGFYTKRDEDQNQRGVEWQGYNLVPGDISNGLLRSGTFNNVVPIIESYTNDRHADLYSVGWNTRYNGHNGWTGMIDLSWSRTDRTDNNIQTTAGTGFNRTGPTSTIAFDWTDHGPEFNVTGGVNYSDPNQVFLTDTQGWGWTRVQAGYDNTRRTRDDIKQARGEVERELGGFFKSLKLGVNYTDRSKSLTADEAYLVPSGAGTCATPSYLNDPTTGVIANTPCAIPIPSQYIIGTTDFMRGFGPILDYDVRGIVNDGVLTAEPNDFGLDKAYTVEEKVLTPYLMATINSSIGANTLTGNVGVQAVYTDQSSSGITHPASGAAQNITVGINYWDILPSLNLALRTPSDFVFRFAASEEMMRPRLPDMTTVINYGPDTAHGNVIYGNGGNPYLKPYKAKALDFNIEKYFGSRGYIALQTFYKHLDRYIVDGQIPFDYSNFPTGSFNPPPPSTMGFLSTKVNLNGGELYGAELAGTLPLEVVAPFLSGFGLTGGLSYTETHIKDFYGNDSVIPGYSKYVGSLTAFYEDHGFNVRGSMRYRSSFLGDFRAFNGQPQNQTVLAETIYDAQIGYDFPATSGLSGLSLYLQGQNLTDEREATIQDNASTDQTAFLKWQTYGRRFVAGFTYKFGAPTPPPPVVAPPPPPPPVATQTCPDGSVIAADATCPVPPPPPPPPPPAPVEKGERGQ